MNRVCNHLVSIIIPCYNAERWLKEAIESALDQTYQDIEVIVVDDGSTDSSLTVIKGFGNRVRWVTGPNRGPCAARNLGIQLVRGDWIQFLDADDALHPQKIEICLKGYEAYPGADFVWAPLAILEGEDKQLTSLSAWHDGDYPEIMLSQNVLRADYAPALALFRKDFISEVGPWNELLTRWVDLEYHARIAVKARSYLHINKPLYFYRSHDGARISDANRDHSKVYEGLRSLTCAREALQKSHICENKWKAVIFPFYIQLSRSAAQVGDANMFCALLFEAAGLRKSALFYSKCYLAMVTVRLLGIRFTSVLMEAILNFRK